jgi:pimeloyl-ACP methyl ester carboxylesterase
VLVGWSSGAFNAWEYLKTYGKERVAGLVVVDEAASDFHWDGWKHGPVELDRLRMMTIGVQVAQRDLARNRFVPGLFTSALEPADLDWMVDEVSSIPPVIAAAVAFDEITRDYREFIPSTPVPTLVCHGRHDALIPLAAGEHVASVTPDARLVVFENSGHAPFYDEPDRFNAEVAAFIDSLPQR